MGRFITADDYPTTGQGLTGNNMFAYCGNNPAVRADNGGQFWNIVIGAAAGAAISAIVTGISSYKENGEVNWASVVVSAAAGAVSGAFAATGIKVRGQMVVNAVIGGVSSAVDTYVNRNEATTIFDYISSTVTGVGIGLVAGKLGGNGTGNKHLSHSAGRFINKAWNAAKNVFNTGLKAAWKQGTKAASYYYSQVATESVKRGVQAILPIAISNIPNILYQLS